MEDVSFRALLGLHIRIGHLGTEVILRNTLMGAFSEVSGLCTCVWVNASIVANHIFADSVASCVRVATAIFKELPSVAMALTARDALRETEIIVPAIFRVLDLLPGISRVAIWVAVAATRLVSLTVYAIKERSVVRTSLDWTWYVRRVALVVRTAVVKIGYLPIRGLQAFIVTFNRARLAYSISIALTGIYIENLVVFAVQGVVKHQVPGAVTHVVSVAVLRVRYELPRVTSRAVFHAVVVSAGLA